MLPSGQAIPSAPPCWYFGAQHLQLLLSARLLLCLRLKNPVARLPPRLSTGGWLGLSGRDSHPLYVKATYARPHCQAPLDQSDAAEVCDRLRNILRPGFAQDILAMIVDGMHADTQHISDILAIESLRDQLEHFFLPLR